MAISPGQPTAVYATGPYGIATSTDEGESWEYHEDDMRSYCQGMALKADDPKVIFVGSGDTIPGTTGDIRVSRDEGLPWAAAALPCPARRA